MHAVPPGKQVWTERYCCACPGASATVSPLSHRKAPVEAALAPCPSRQATPRWEAGQWDTAGPSGASWEASLEPRVLSGQAWPWGEGSPMLSRRPRTSRAATALSLSGALSFLPVSFFLGHKQGRGVKPQAPPTPIPAEGWWAAATAQAYPDSREPGQYPGSQLCPGQAALACSEGAASPLVGNQVWEVARAIFHMDQPRDGRARSHRRKPGSARPSAAPAAAQPVRQWSNFPGTGWHLRVALDAAQLAPGLIL